MSKEQLISVLKDFFGFNNPDGTYAYWLTRVKEGFSVGTVSLDDFEEFSEDTLNELADEILSINNKE